MWCSSAVNRSFPFFLAASRTRCSPLVPFSWLSVQYGSVCPAFSLVGGLSSTASSGGFPLLFGRFVGNTPPYDSPLSCMWVLSLIAFSHRPAAFHHQAAAGSPGSRAWSFYACLGSATPPGDDALAFSRIALLPSDSDNTVGSRIAYFEARCPCLHMYLSTLQV